METSSVDNCHERDQTECDAFSAAKPGDNSCSDDDFEPDGTSPADSEYTGDDSGGEISDILKNSQATARANTVDTHVFKKAVNRVSPNLERLSLFRKRERKSGCKQSYDKIHYCVFCGHQIRSKISRHLLNVHTDEMAVKDILLLPKRFQQRRTSLQKLTNEGNFKLNITVMQEKLLSETHYG